MSRWSMYNEMGRHRFLNDPEALNDLAQHKTDIHELTQTMKTIAEKHNTLVKQMQEEAEMAVTVRQLIDADIRRTNDRIDLLSSSLVRTNESIDNLIKAINEDRERIQACHDYCFTNRIGWIEGTNHNLRRSI